MLSPIPSDSPLRAPRRSFTAILAAVLFAGTMLASVPQAEISGGSTKPKDTKLALQSIGGASTATDAEYTAVLEQYVTLLEKIKADKATATTMRTARDAQSPTFSDTDYANLLEQIADDEVTAETLYVWLSDNAEETPTDKDTGKNGRGKNRDDEDGNGSSGSGSGGGMEDMLKGMAQNMAQSMAQQLLSGGMGNLGASLGNPLNGGLGAGAGAGAGAGTGQTGANGQQAPELTPEQKAAAEKEAKRKAKCAAPTGRSMTERNPGKAKDDIVATKTQFSSPYTTQSEVPTSPASTEANPGKAKDDECTASDYTTPTPTGKGSKTEQELLDAQGQFYCDPGTSNCSVNGRQCASLTKYFSPEIGSASSWRQGENVLEGNLTPGTPVATFNYGDNYCKPGLSTCGEPGAHKTHTGIFVNYIKNSQGKNIGFNMLYQWAGSNGKGAAVVKPYYNQQIGNRQDTGQYYYTIKGATSLNDIIPLLQPVWVALKLLPADMGLSRTFPTPYTTL